MKYRKLIVFIILSIIIGCIFIYPDIRFIMESGSKFKGLTLTAMPDEEFYLARLNAVYHGDYRLANTGIYEHRNDLWLNPPYFEVIMALAGKTLGLPVVYLDIILSFMFPVIIFWLIYLLVLILSSSGYLGVLVGSSIILGYNFFTFKPALIKSILLPHHHTVGLWFLRPFSPQLIYIPFILSLIAIYRFIDSKTIWKLFITSILIALLNYLHIHLWGFIAAGLSVYFLISIRVKNKRIIKNILFVVLCSLILAIPFWLNTYKVALNPNYHFLELMFGIKYTHRPIIPFGYIFVILSAGYLNKDIYKNMVFLISFLAGGLVCLNQQILTGKIVEIIHWTSYTNKTLVIIALIIGLGRIAKKFSALPKRVVFYAIIVFLFLVGVIQQNNYYNANKDIFLERQRLSGAFAWLNANTNKEEVILTESINFYSRELLRMLMVYTPNYYYLAVDPSSLISEEEFQYRFLAAMRFFHYTKPDAEEIINFTDGMNFTCMSARYGTLKDKDNYLDKIRAHYDNLAYSDPLSVIKRYKVDYVFLKKGDRFFENIESVYPALSRVFDDGFCRIFKFKI